MKGFKLENLPRVNTVFRQAMINTLTAMETYCEDLKKGLPFFSEEELIEIEEKFQEKGMTKKEIMAEIYKKGWPLKENTLKHYIQTNQIPRAQGRVKTNRGMISYYPANIIRHLNFTRYCIFSGSETAHTLNSLFEKLSIQDKNILIERSEETDAGMGGNDCINALWIGVSRINEGIGWTEETIELAFANNKTKKTMYLNKINKINQLADRLEKEIREFEILSEKNTSLVKMDHLDEKEKNDETN